MLSPDIVKTAVPYAAHGGSFIPARSHAPVLERDFARHPLSRFTNIDFLRSSDIAGWNSDGKLYEVGSDVMFKAYDPATKKSLGYRALQGFTNSLLWSRDASQSPWADVGGATTVARNAVGMDGEPNTATTITDDSESVSLGRRQDVTVPDDSNPNSVVIHVGKDDDESRFPSFDLTLDQGTVIVNRVHLNTKTGELTDEIVTSGDANPAAATDKGDFWELPLTITNNGTGNTRLRFAVYSARAATPGTNDASATGSIVYDFGGIYLNSSIPGPPIETEGSPVSTADDDATEPLPTSCQDGFVAVIHARTAPNDPDTTQTLVSIDDGSFDNRAEIYVNNKGDIRWNIREAGVGIFDSIIKDAVTGGVDLRIAARFDGGNYAVSINGEAVQTEASTVSPNNLSVKNIGRNAQGDRQWDGTIAYDALYDNPADWTDQDLVEATS